MSDSRLAAEGAARAGSVAGRVRRAWKVLPSERRLAAFASAGLFLSLFLPWYQETVIPTSAAGAKLGLPSASMTGWAAFSFVEAAVLLVAVGVLVLLFLRAEGRAFHVPGGDGGVITAAGLWTVVLIVWRMFDKEGTSGHGQYVSTSGIEWGIFIALGVAVLLAYAGTRIRMAHEPEPPLPGEDAEPPAGPGRRRSRRRPAASSPEQGRPAASGPARSQVVEDVTWSYDETRTAVTRPPAAADSEPPTEPTRTRRPDRSLNFSELHDIELDDPPEAPTVRRRTRIEDFDPSEAPTSPGEGPDEQLTFRLRPDR